MTRGLWGGALAGLFGGVLFWWAAQFAMAATLSSLLRTDSLAAALTLHLLIAAAIGAGFGVLVAVQRPRAADMLFWGLAYGALWWVVGPLTLLPLLVGRPAAWDLPSAQEQLPSLIGHVLYGASTALALVALGLVVDRRLRRDPSTQPAADSFRGGVLRGALAGIVAAWALEATLGLGTRVMATAGPGPRPLELLWVGIGLVWGAGYALGYPQPSDSAGAALIRGAGYGFLWWVVGVLTVLPLLMGAEPAWTVMAAQARFAALPGCLLLGAAVAPLHQWSGIVARSLFYSSAGARAGEGAGVRGLRAGGAGAVAGLVGGLVFSLVMAQIGFLPTVARLIGSTSPLTGFATHLLIANLIGASYGLLFHRQSYDLGSALGWGVSYGLLWWILGPLTLLPVLLGGEPQWSAQVAAGTFASLIGHIAYGAALGVTFERLEDRNNPWWVARSAIEAERAQLRRQQVLSAAPALWVLMTVIALMMPLLLVATT